MFKNKFFVYRIITLAGDLFLLNLAFILSWSMHQASIRNFDWNFTGHIFFWVSASWLYLGFIFRLYNTNRMERYEQSFRHQLQTVFTHILVIVLLVFLLKNFYLAQETIFYSYLIFVPLDLLWRSAMIYMLQNFRISASHFRKAIIIGSGSVSQQILKILKTHKGYGYKVLGVFDDAELKADDGFTLTGDIKQAKEFCISRGIEDVFCTLPLSESAKISDIMSFSERNLLRFKLVPDFISIHNRPFVIDYYGLLPVLSPTPEPLSNYFNAWIKRIFDFVFSLLVIVLILSWLIPLVGIIILIDSGFPVFYRQNRSGLNYRTFKIIKFRTMKVVESDDEFIQAKKNDPRITRVGKFLRKYNVDELPQFLNVFIGDMSVVGPRPHPLKLNEEYKSIVSKYMIRHLVKPGLTGMAQVKGFRGETSDKTQMQKRIASDVFYIESWSFLLDIKIIVQTIINLLKGEKNAY